MQFSGKDEPKSQEIIRIKELNKPYRHRIVDGPKQVLTVFYPSIDADGKPKKFIITVPSWRDSIFDSLAKIDEKIQKTKIYDRMGRNDASEKAAKMIRSQLSPTTTFQCLVIDKKDDVPVVRRAEYKTTVNKELVRLESERVVDTHGNRDETKLRYGLLWMLIMEITKIESKKDSNLPANFNTEYKTMVLSELYNACFGQVPSYLLNKPISIDLAAKALVVHPAVGKPVPFPVIEWGMMTEAEWSAIVNCELDLASLVKPMTQAEAIERLEKNPLQINAVDDKGNFLLPDWQQIRDEMSKQNLRLPINDSPVSELPAHTDTPPAPQVEAPVAYTVPDDIPFPDDEPADAPNVDFNWGANAKSDPAATLWPATDTSKKSEWPV
jgi:hypothetical protein